MMELTLEARLDPIIGDASYHQVNGNKPQVCYGLKYPARMMHSFLFGRLPPLEGVELDDGKGNGSARENILFLTHPITTGVKACNQFGRTGPAR